MRAGEAEALKLHGEWEQDHLCQDKGDKASLAALIAATAYADTPASLAIDALRLLSTELLTFAELFAHGGTDLVPSILHAHFCAMSSRAGAFAELSRRINAANPKECPAPVAQKAEAAQ